MLLPAGGVISSIGGYRLRSHPGGPPLPTATAHRVLWASARLRRVRALLANEADCTEQQHSTPL
jgi:hypothetical protein